jgi:hypothetical protein
MSTITDEMVEAGLQHYSEGGCCGLDTNERREVVRAILEASTEKLFERITHLTNVLADCEDYFDRRSDADCDQDGFIPNDEMRHLTAIREAIAKAEGRA